MKRSPLRRASILAAALRIGAPAALAATMVAPPSALAQDADVVARAREQFRQGLSLEAAGDYPRALATFTEVALVKSTPQVRYHIAFCQEKTGDYVAALGSYRLALHEARESGATDVEGPAQEALAALEPKIPKLTIQRGEGASVAEITLDDKPLAASSVGTPVLVNPGPHVVKATAPGRKPALIELSLQDGEAKEIALTMEELPPEPVAPVAPVAPGPDAAGPEQPPPSKSSPIRTAGFFVGGAGLASLAVSGIFFGLRAGAISDLDAQCGPDGQSCPASAQSTYDSGKTYSTVSTATFIAGLALVAGGVGMVLFAPKPKPATTGLVAVAPGAAGGPGGATVLGRF